jgi:hypothetical protein
MLGKLDGNALCTYSIWRGTNPESIIVTRRDAGETFIQAAGSAEALTVEVRLIGEDGEGRLFTVGKPQPADGPTVLLPISAERAVRVRSNEVFTAGEAAKIFADYYLTDAVAGTYTLRELDLSASQSERR